MKTTILFLLFLSHLNIITAQESAFNKIKELYYKANSDNYQTHKLNMNTMRAAIGLQNTDVVFYYNSQQVNPEESHYKLDYHVVKIEVSYNISASMDYKIEYLFDENKNLIFYFSKVEGMWENSSLRYYLENNKLIKVISKSTNENGENEDYTDLKKFSQNDVNFANEYIQKSKKYLAFFNEMIKIEKLDK